MSAPKMLQSLVAATCLFLAALPSRGIAADKLAGPAFSDPASRQEMPEQWERQPVRYKTEGRPPDLAIDINQQLYPKLLPFIQEYAAKNKLAITVTKGTCGKSTAMLGRKEIDIGSFCCPPATVDRLPGLRYHTLGVMPAAIMIHPANPVSSLRWRDIQRIFAGEITDWSEVGGAKLRIKPIVSFHCKERPGDWHLLLASPDLFGPNILEVGDMPDMISQVAKDTAAIGYEVELIAETFRGRGDVKALRIDGVSPKELEPLLRGRYPIYRTYNVTTWEGKHLEKRQAALLVEYLMKKVEGLGPEDRLIPASRLRAAGWRFKGSELVGAP